MNDTDLDENLSLNKKRRRNDDRGAEQLPRTGSQQGEPHQPAGEPVFPGGAHTDAALDLTDGNQQAEERLRAADAEGRDEQDQSDATSDTQQQDAEEQRRKAAQLNRQRAEGGAGAVTGPGSENARVPEDSARGAGGSE